MRFPLLFVLLLSTRFCFGQPATTPDDFLSRLRGGGPVPAKLLSKRSVVIHPHTFTSKELLTIQQSFQQTGIDAVAYFEQDLLLAGRDMAAAMAHYFTRRDIMNMVFFQKKGGRYEVYITGFNTKETFIEQNQVAWQADDATLADLLKKIYRAAAGGLERENFLISRHPETSLGVNPIAGRRSEFFAIDLKVDQAAVPKTGNAAADKTLEEIFSTRYPFKYKLTEPGKPEKELRFEGNFYVLCFLYARASVLKEVLGYDTGKSESAYVSVTYPNGQQELKNIPADAYVYKFYFKHIDSGNVFLGTKWDADTTWEQALTNHIMAFKAELKLN